MTASAQQPMGVTRAAGTFELRIAPLPADDYADAAVMGRLTIDKTFSGDLIGTSKGQMLTGMGAMKGSAAYVAIEYEFDYRLDGAASQQ